MTSNQLFALGYAHPSTLVIVDDHQAFLRDLELNIPNSVLYEMFTTPAQARDYFNDIGGADQSLVHRALEFHSNYGEDALLRVKMETLESAIVDPNRFKLPTVMITDYAMPSMNGLELCEEINDPSVKKILLTGEADVNVGIEAFNAGIIDRFVTKQGAGVAQDVFDSALMFQARYFSDLQNPFLSATNISLFFQDRTAIERVAEIKAQGKYVEHYLQVEPFGYLMATASGDLGRIVIYDETDVERTLEIAKAHNAPDRILERLNSRSHVMTFVDAVDGYQYGDEEYPWDENIAPAEQVSGIVDWYIAEDKSPAAPAEYDASVASFDRVYFSR